ncbi:MAG: hypothetical protein M5U28_38830 [Sandaracinaceae bacterium]|nr:hypothetical protein [Sandaracinaceae bacterium]
MTAAQTIADRVRRSARSGAEEDAAAMVAALAAALDGAHEPAHATQIAHTLLDLSSSTSTAGAAPALLSALREGRGEPPRSCARWARPARRRCSCRSSSACPPTRCASGWRCWRRCAATSIARRRTGAPPIRCWPCSAT